MAVGQGPRSRVALLLIIAAVSIGTALFVGARRPPRLIRIPEGVRVDGIDLSGLSRAEAEAMLRPLLLTRANRPWTLRWGEQKWQVYPQQAGFAYDMEASLEQALAAGRSQPWWGRSWGPSRVDLADGDLALNWRLDESTLNQLFDRLAETLDKPPRNASYDPALGRVVPDQNGSTLDREALRRLLEVAATGGGATDIALPVRTVPATVREADVAAVGHHVLSSFSTRANLADPDRLANIHLAVEKINGTLLRPGETFSFNQAVGPREPRFGFRQAKELYQGEYVLGYGGGVCQVSSTLYNAALLADLDIAARSHHSRPLSYVETGRDATVAYDYLDFRFTNTAPAPVLLVSSLQNDRLTVSFLGRRSATSKRVEIVTEGLMEVAAPLQEELDETMPWRSRQVVNPGEPGYEVTVLRRVYEGSRLVREEMVSHDKYPPRPGLVRVGLKPPDMPADPVASPLTP